MSAPGGGDPRATACREALCSSPSSASASFGSQWRVLYKAEASPYRSRELLLLRPGKKNLSHTDAGSLSAASGPCGSVHLAPAICQQRNGIQEVRILSSVPG